jgi:NitT/TauT family transport system substrate-binding protein
MMTITRKTGLLFAALGLAGLALGYLGWQARPAPPAPEALSIALPSLPHSALVHIAIEKGYFAEEGLALSVTPVSHGRAALELVMAGKADLATHAETPLVISVMKGADLAIAASIMSHTDGNKVVARRDRRISTPAGLANSRIGVTFGTSGDYFLWAFLIRNKLEPRAVTFVDQPPGKIVEALASGAVDAVATWEPIASQAQAALGANGATFRGQGAYTETHVIAGMRDFLVRHPGTMQKLVRALLKAEQFNHLHPEDAMALVAKRLKTDAQTLQPIWTLFNFRVDLLQSQLITLEDEARWAMERGYVEARALPNFLHNLYLDALLAVRPERVTVIQ